MDEWLAFFKTHKWRVLGVLGGVIFCILIFTINFWRTLLLFRVVGGLYFIGRLLDEGGWSGVAEFFSRIFSRK